MRLHTTRHISKIGERRRCWLWGELYSPPKFLCSSPNHPVPQHVTLFGDGGGGGFACIHAKSLSHVQLFATPWTVAHQAPLSMGFSRQECWSGLPFPPPGDLPEPGIEPESLLSPALARRFFTTCATMVVYCRAHLIEMRSLVWVLVQQDQCPCEDGKLGHRHAQREDSCLQAKERCPEQSLSCQPSEGTNLLTP